MRKNDMSRLMTVCEKKGKVKLTNTEVRALEYIFNEGKQFAKAIPMVKKKLTETIIAERAGFRDNKQTQKTRGQRCYEFVIFISSQLFNEFLKYDLDYEDEEYLKVAINKAKKDGAITAKEAIALHNMRFARNHAVHNRKVSRRSIEIREKWKSYPSKMKQTRGGARTYNLVKGINNLALSSSEEEFYSEEMSGSEKSSSAEEWSESKSSRYSRSSPHFFKREDSSSEDSNSSDSNSESSEYSSSSSESPLYFCKLDGKYYRYKGNNPRYRNASDSESDSNEYSI